MAREGWLYPEVGRCSDWNSSSSSASTLLVAGARRQPGTGRAPPILLLVCGVLLGFVPALREVQLPPEAMLLLFLPALLYWESLTTSLREIRNNLRVIVLTSTLLVIATAAAVAAVGHALGLPWGPAWVLGAALAPTDATAVGVLARALPRRTVTTLRAESLVNDGTALVVYGLAVGVTVGEESLGDAARGGAVPALLRRRRAGGGAGRLAGDPGPAAPGRPAAGERAHPADPVQRLPAGRGRPRLRRPRRRRLRADHEPGRPAHEPGRHPPDDRRRSGRCRPTCSTAPSSCSSGWRSSRRSAG